MFQYKNLIRNKYAPRNLNGFLGQNQASTILRNMIKKKLIYPGLIFSGPYGTGKTSMSKIFIKTLNCLNIKNEIECCNECKNCLLINEGTSDFMELDGATYNGVDNVRFIIENCQYPPQELKYKTFIIDECHMLTNEAFNSFLKTLEYPPERVIFIFVTTEEKKIPDTIKSRCITIKMNSLNNKLLASLFQFVEKSEKISIPNDVREIIIRKSNGSARDLLVLIDEIMIGDIKNANDALKVFGYCSLSNVFDIYFAILQGQINEAVKKWKQLYYNGCFPINFLNDLLQVVNQCISFKNTDKKIIQDQYSYAIENISNISNKFLFKHWEILIYMIGKQAYFKDNYVEIVLIMMSLIEAAEKESDYISMLHSMFPDGKIEGLR